MIFFIVNIHICMFFTPQFNVFLYFMHMHTHTLVLFVYLLLKRAPRKIGYQPIGFPSQNKEFTYLLIRVDLIVPEQVWSLTLLCTACNYRAEHHLLLVYFRYLHVYIL